MSAPNSRLLTGARRILESARRNAGEIAPALVFFLVIALRFAEPVQDGDLFWHMEYARQMMAHGRLVTDHTLYSWTPASNEMLYCAWLAEFAFYGLWKIGGLALIFAFRYAAVLGAVALQFDLARRCGWRRTPLFWLILLIFMVASYAGTLPKPELFSFLFFNLLVWMLFRAKLAAFRGGHPARWLGCVPALFLVWVNTHGAFILAGPLLAAFTIGETIHWRSGDANAAGRLPLKPMLASFALSALAAFATPYGWRYPAQLIADYVLHKTARPDALWNSAYRSIFSGASEIIPFPMLLLAMAAIFGVALLRGKRGHGQSMDWGVALAFVAYAPLFMAYLRATFYLPAIFAAGTLYSLRASEARLPADGSQARPGDLAQRRLWRVALAGFLLLAFQTLHHIIVRPVTGSWVGFGIGGANPRDEAEFLARQRPASPRLINLFNTGGYLLWRLWPQHQVMVDSRSFPYLSWFEDQYRFGTGKEFDAFLAKYPAPVAVIDVNRPEVWRQFLKAKEWQPVFYGRAAIVFQRADLPDAPPFSSVPEEQMRIANADDAINLFTFASAVGDYATAWRIEEQCGRIPMRWRIAREGVDQMHAYHQAHRALAGGDFEKALEFFRKGVVGNRDEMILIMLEARARTSVGDPQREVIEKGLRRMAAPR